MALIHHTTIKPTKLELLTEWLPTRPWYRGAAASPVLAKSGGFRLDDPADEVGIEFMVTTDTSAAEPVAYLVPMTYRGAPLEGAEDALISTVEHGVLGKRWAYDGFHDPVLVAELLRFIDGRAQAAAQSVSHALDEEVVRSYSGEPFPLDGFAPAPVDDADGTRLVTPLGSVLHVHRALQAVPGTSVAPAADALGHVARPWQGPDGAQLAAVFMTLIAAERT
jgi:hypothetical protein